MLVRQALLCDACDSGTPGLPVVVACFFTTGTFLRTSDSDLYEETEEPVTTRILKLCSDHEAELLRPVIRLAQPFSFP